MSFSKKYKKWIDQLTDKEIEELLTADYPVKELPSLLDKKILNRIKTRDKESRQKFFSGIKPIIAYTMAALICLFFLTYFLLIQKPFETAIQLTQEQTGTVYISSGNREPVRLSSSTRIKVGNVLETKAESSLTCQVGALASLSLDENTVLSFNKLSLKGKQEEVAVFLKQGTALFSLDSSHSGLDWIVETDVIMIRVTGTEFRVRVQDNSTLVTVYKGSVQVKSRIDIKIPSGSASSSVNLLNEKIDTETTVNSGMEVQIDHASLEDAVKSLQAISDTLIKIEDSTGLTASDTLEYDQKISRIMEGIIKKVRPSEPEPLVTGDPGEIEASPVPKATGSPDMFRERSPSTSMPPIPLSTPGVSSPTSKDISAVKQAVLDYITLLSTDEEGKAMVGQACGDGNWSVDIFQQVIGNLYEQTGKWPAILSVEYEYGLIFTREELSAANEMLINYWNNNGLIHINWTPLNPWVNDETAAANISREWSGPDNKSSVNLADLTDPSAGIYSVWRRKLDRLADTLLELKNAGVVVLWVPLPWMNNPVNWYGPESHFEDPGPAIDLYRDLYDYFTREKGLENLIWVYAADVGYSDAADPRKNKPMNWCYPGSDYVDIVTGMIHDNRLRIPAYQDMLKLGKPVGMSMFSPVQTYIKDDTGLFDNKFYIKQVKMNYPALAFWIVHNNWKDSDGNDILFSISRNQNATELMHDPHVITREDLSWQQ